MIRDHGSRRKYEHEIYGFNSRMDTLQAVVLSAKLRRLDDWNAARRKAAARYESLLAQRQDIFTPRVLEGNEHVWHLYVVNLPDRDQALKELHAAGISAGIHYPAPIHLIPAFADLGYVEGNFPVAERAARSILSLPIFPEITAEQQEYIISVLIGAALKGSNCIRSQGSRSYADNRVHRSRPDPSFESANREIF